ESAEVSGRWRETPSMIKVVAAERESTRAGSRLRLARLAWYVPLTLGAMVLLVPLYWLLASSLKERGQIFVVPPVWIPNPIVWSNYPRAFSVLPFGLFLRNSLTIVILNVVGVVLTASLVAFVFSRMRFPGRGLWFSLIISTMMLPGVVTLIPTFIL